MVVQSLTARQLESLRCEGVPMQIVDVRSPDEYALGHLPGALNLPVEQLPARRHDLDSAWRVVVVCQSGTRATLACESLNDDPLDVWRLDGGTEAWIREGLPVVRCTSAQWSLERQVRLIAGAFVLVGSALALTLSPTWALLPLGIGAGLTFAGLTNRCGLALLLGRMPWNRETR